MFIETGTLVFMSLAVVVWRLPRKTMLWLFGHPAYLELPFGLVAYWLHAGTFSGMMAAATAAIICFAFVQSGRYLVGYTDKTGYHSGVLRNYAH